MHGHKVRLYVCFSKSPFTIFTFSEILNPSIPSGKYLTPKMSRLYPFYRYDILIYMLKITILKQLRA